MSSGNVTASADGNFLNLRIPMNSGGVPPFPLSSTGKSQTVATTGGFQAATLALPNGTTIPLKISLNVQTDK